MPKERPRRYKLIAIGVSTGGVWALQQLLGALPRDFPLPLLIVHHISPDTGDRMALLLDQLCEIHVKEADEQEVPVGGNVYLAPANYHLLVEPDGRLGLSTEAPVSFARPSVDLLFETAAEALGEGVIGVVLTGAGSDGSFGVKRIREKGGVVVVQDPQDAVASSMPLGALQAVKPDYLVPLASMPKLFIELSEAR